AARRGSRGRAPADRRLSGHDARAVDEDVSRAPGRARAPLRDRGRPDRRALARRLPRGRGRRFVRADLELLRGRRGQAAVRRLRIGLPLAAIVLLAWLFPLGAQDTRLPPVFDGAAALRHIEGLVAIGPRPAGSAGATRARTYIVDELRKAGVAVRVDAFDSATPHRRLPLGNSIATVPGRRADLILIVAA